MPKLLSWILFLFLSMFKFSCTQLCIKQGISLEHISQQHIPQTLQASFGQQNWQFGNPKKAWNSHKSIFPSPLKSNLFIILLISDSKYDILFLSKKFLKLVSSIQFQLFTAWYKSCILKSYLCLRSSNKDNIFLANSTSLANNCLKAWSIKFDNSLLSFWTLLDISPLCEHSLWRKFSNSGYDNTPS